MHWTTGAIDVAQPLNRRSHFARGLVGLWLPINQPPFIGGARLFNMCGLNHADLVGGPTWTGGGSLVGSRAALVLDGSDDYASVPDADILDFDGAATDWSIGICFRRKTHDTNDGILSKKAGTSSASPGYSVMTTDGGDQAFFTFHDTGASERIFFSATTFNDSARWYDLTVTYSLAETRGRMFVDCIQEYTDNISDIGDCSNAEPLNFGVEAGATNAANIDIAYVYLFHRLLAAEDQVALREELRRGCPNLLNRVRRYLAFDTTVAAGGDAVPQVWMQYRSRRAA